MDRIWVHIFWNFSCEKSASKHGSRLIFRIFNWQYYLSFSVSRKGLKKILRLIICEKNFIVKFIPINRNSRNFLDGQNRTWNWWASELTNKNNFCILRGSKRRWWCVDEQLLCIMRSVKCISSQIYLQALFEFLMSRKNVFHWLDSLIFFRSSKLCTWFHTQFLTPATHRSLRVLYCFASLAAEFNWTLFQCHRMRYCFFWNLLMGKSVFKWIF